jgi:putative flippase GtrA
MIKIHQIIANRHVTELIQYVIASAIALFFDYSVYLLLTSFDVLTLPQAAVCGYIFGLFVAYILISGRVFKNGWLADKRHFETLLFGISGLIGIGLTYLSVKLFIYVFGEHINSSKMVAVIISFTGVYIFRKFFVFKGANGNA